MSGLTGRRERLLSALTAPKSRADLSFELGETRDTVSSLLAQLREEGYVRSFGKPLFYWLTAKGQAYVEERFAGDNVKTAQASLATSMIVAWPSIDAKLAERGR